MFLLDPSYWEVKETPHKGKGIFACKNIDGGTVLGDYLGSLIDPEKEDIHEKNTGFYVFTFSENLSVFPDLTNTGLHLINHSCSPNCETDFYKNHMLYYANRKIFAGEELTVSYSLTPPSGEIEPTYPCYCESSICRGTMYASYKSTGLKRTDEYLKNNVEELKKYKKGDVLKPLDAYPLKLPFNPIDNIYGYEKSDSLHIADKKLPSVEDLKKNIYSSGKTLLYDEIGLQIIGIEENTVLGRLPS